MFDPVVRVQGKLAAPVGSRGARRQHFDRESRRPFDAAFADAPGESDLDEHDIRLDDGRLAQDAIDWGVQHL